MKKIILLTSCLLLLAANNLKAQNQPGDSAIAPGFHNFTGTLLFIKSKYDFESLVKRLRVQLGNYYHGDYEFINGKELVSGNYFDMNKFPFLIQIREMAMGGNKRYLSFIMFNRVTGEEHKSEPFLDKKSLYDEVCTQYAQALERLRGK